MSSKLMERLKKNQGMGAAMVAQQRAALGGFQKDSRIWKHTFDEKKKVSINRIRFLPTPDCDLEAQERGDIPEDFPLAPVSTVFSHNFKGPTGRYYKAISPQTWGHTCPVREYDRAGWDKAKATDDKALKDILKERIASTDYYANILVIEDAQNPENNNKVFLFKFGNGLKKVLDAAGSPKFPTDPSIADPFCPFTGAVLVYELEGEERTIGTWSGLVAKDFGRCRWEHESRLAETDEEIEAICSKAYSLYDFVDVRKEEPYSVLETRFREVMGIPVDAPLVNAGEVEQAPANNAAEMARKALAEAEKQQKSQEAPVQGGDTTAQTQGTQTPAAAGSEEEFDDFLKQLENE